MVGRDKSHGAFQVREARNFARDRRRRLGIPVAQSVETLRVGRVQVPAQAHVECQPPCQLPIVLDIQAVVLAGASNIECVLDGAGVRYAQQKGREAVPLSRRGGSRAGRPLRPLRAEAVLAVGLAKLRKIEE